MGNAGSAACHACLEFEKSLRPTQESGLVLRRSGSYDDVVARHSQTRAAHAQPAAPAYRPSAAAYDLGEAAAGASRQGAAVSQHMWQLSDHEASPPPTRKLKLTSYEERRQQLPDRPRPGEEGYGSPMDNTLT